MGARCRTRREEERALPGSSPRPLRVVVADDQPEVRAALRLLLEQEEGLDVVAEAASVPDLLHLVTVTPCDLVLFDWDLSGGSARPLVSALRSRRPGLHLVALGSQPEDCATAIRAGADAYASKAGGAAELLCVLAGVRGRTSLCGRM
ncbi:MAG: response regulator transcription factor [Firmicutes bacterium]|nr:response regulator transcription factor [Bacillota bacterium]